jgi:predicted kinase
VGKLIVTVGIPNSGKTTWAERMVDTGVAGRVVNVNRDDLRLEMFDRKKSDKGKWKHEAEVVAERNRRIEEALAQGKTVISSDTNFSAHHMEYFKQLAKKHGAVFEKKYFYIPVSEAEERDAKRPDGVGPKVIRRFWRDHIIQEYEWREGLTEVILCDLDGTIARAVDRDIFQEQHVERDEYIETVGTAVQLMAKHYGAKLFITSGRHEGCKDATERWLKKHNFKYDAIYMRPNPITKGHEPADYLVKQKFFDEINPSYNIRCVFDDRMQICDLWRELGIQVFQCNDGRF